MTQVVIQVLLTPTKDLMRVMLNRDQKKNNTVFKLRFFTIFIDSGSLLVLWYPSSVLEPLGMLSLVLLVPSRDFGSSCGPRIVTVPKNR